MNIRGELSMRSGSVLFYLELAEERREGRFPPTELWDFFKAMILKIVHEG